MQMETDIARICRMEALFDEVSAALEHGVPCNGLQEKIRLLTAYMDGGQWLLDYEADERGQWPSDLKRGVLSQDGLYNLLSMVPPEWERMDL